MNGLERLLQFLSRLDALSIRYSLAHERADTITVRIRVPGECWDIGFLTDGSMDVETFAGTDGVVTGEEAQALVQRLLSEGGSDA